MMDKGGKPKAKREPVGDAPKASPRPSVTVSERPPASTPTTPTATSSSDRGEPIAVRRPLATRIAPKKRGIAMDVIQSAKPVAVTPPSSRPSRTGAALQPTGHVAPETVQTPQPAHAGQPSVANPPSDDVSDDTLASLDMQKDGFARPKTVVEEPPKPHPAAKSAFPDPLDVHGFNDQETPKQPETAAKPQKSETEPKNTWDPLLDDAPEPQTEAPAEPEPEVAAPELSASPFLNAKVEKRPLGAFASHIPAPQPEVAPETPPNEPTHAEPVAHTASDATWQSPAGQSVAETAEPERTAPEPTDDPKVASTPLDHLRGASIPPQYHAAEKESNKDDRPIFDTKNYHTPIEAHASHRRTGGSHAGIMLTVILIILLIAAGVAAYFVATGGIDLQKLF